MRLPISSNRWCVALPNFHHLQPSLRLYQPLTRPIVTVQINATTNPHPEAVMRFYPDAAYQSLIFKPFVEDITRG